MGITGIPATYQEFATVLDDYERVHFDYDAGVRAVADSTLDLMTTFPLNDKLPKPGDAAVRRALMDAPYVRRLGTFPPGCPVPHDGPQPAAADGR